ncbi:MAG: hypothetical protein HOV87_14505 [Catenulispora sp.]|nr:hypothetical protein [Catenulispora sp.]
MRVFTRFTLAVCTAGIVLGAGGTAAIAAAGSTSAAPHTTRATGTAQAAALSCAGLDQVFQSPQTNGHYPVTIVSNQPDGIVGFAGSEGAGNPPGGMWSRFSGTQLSGSTSNDLFSDRTHFTRDPGGGFGGTYQPFTINAPASLSYTLSRAGAGQYTVGLTFGADINRQFTFTAQCIGEALVGYTNAIGNNEFTDNATYAITIGNFVADPIIH